VRKKFGVGPNKECAKLNWQAARALIEHPQAITHRVLTKESIYESQLRSHQPTTHWTC